MKKKLYKSIYLIKKKIRKKEYYYFLQVPNFSILIPKIGNKFILVSQKRYAINKVTLEFPSGWIDKNEKPSAASIRETFEETGYKSLIKPKKIIDFHEEPGRLTSNVYVYFSDKLKKLNKTEKNIKVHLLTQNEIFNLIKKKKFNNGTHIAAYLAFLNNTKIK